MNDPHVESLSYRLELGDTLSVTDAPPLQHETDAFTLRLEAGKLTASMKELDAQAPAPPAFEVDHARPEPARPRSG